LADEELVAGCRLPVVGCPLLIAGFSVTRLLVINTPIDEPALSYRATTPSPLFAAWETVGLAATNKHACFSAIDGGQAIDDE
jgi:hypothetical protein